MRNNYFRIVPALAVMALLFTDCKARREQKKEAEEILREVKYDAEPDVTGPFTAILGSDTVRIIFGDGESTGFMTSKADREHLYADLSDIPEDTELNASGIMLKMTVPDYSILAAGWDRDDYTPATLWPGSHKMKFRGVWYRIPDSLVAGLTDLLEKYRGTDPATPL